MRQDMAAWALAAALAGEATGATTLTLQNGLNGYAGTADAWLDDSYEGRNYGSSATLELKWNNGYSDTMVIRFDLVGQIPSNQRILSATLGLWYVTESSMQDDNAITIKPFRISPGASWYENVYNGVSGYGVSWDWRDNGETLAWSGTGGGWYDKVDDWNGTARIKPEGGTALNAVDPQNWVNFDVRASVSNWYAGAGNQGLLLAATGWEGGGTTASGIFIARNDSLQSTRPRLVITYEAIPEPGVWALLAMALPLFARLGRIRASHER